MAIRSLIAKNILASHYKVENRSTLWRAFLSICLWYQGVSIQLKEQHSSAHFHAVHLNAGWPFRVHTLLIFRQQNDISGRRCAIDGLQVRVAKLLHVGPLQTAILEQGQLLRRSKRHWWLLSEHTICPQSLTQHPTIRFSTLGLPASCQNVHHCDRAGVSIALHGKSILHVSAIRFWPSAALSFIEDNLKWLLRYEPSDNVSLFSEAIVSKLWSGLLNYLSDWQIAKCPNYSEAKIRGGFGDHRIHIFDFNDAQNIGRSCQLLPTRKTDNEHHSLYILS